MSPYALESSQVAKKNQDIKIGDVFTIPLKERGEVLAQIIDLPWPGPRIAIFDRVLSSDSECEKNLALLDPFAILIVTPELLKWGRWRVRSNVSVNIARERWPQEELASKQWVGVHVHGAGLVEDFVSAYFGQAPWDAYYIPEFLDAFLLDPNRKPQRLIYTRRNQ